MILHTEVTPQLGCTIETEADHFRAWMHRVDVACYAMVGVSVHGLPDAPFWDMFEGGYTIPEVVEEVCAGW